MSANIGNRAVTEQQRSGGDRAKNLFGIFSVSGRPAMLATRVVYNLNQFSGRNIG
jgi:hypothetical protein